MKYILLNFEVGVLRLKMETNIGQTVVESDLVLLSTFSITSLLFIGPV